MSTSVRQLRDYELGKRPPSVAMLEQWLEALEAPPIELTRPIVPAKPKRATDATEQSYFKRSRQ